MFQNAPEQILKPAPPTAGVSAVLPSSPDIPNEISSDDAL